MKQEPIIDKVKRHLNKSATFRYVKGYRKLLPRRRLQFEIHLADHCNLNCRGCDNYSPLAKQELLDLEEYKRDCGRLAELFGGKMRRITFMGGEPLLHPQIEECMKISRECFPVGKICVITNGLLLPKMKDGFWKACKRYHVDITPTKYPVNFDYDAMERRAEAEGVNYSYYAGGYVVKTMNKIPLNPQGKGSLYHNFIHCHRSNACIMLKHGKLYTCTAVPNAPIINDYFHLNMDIGEENGIDIYQAANKREIMKFLARPIPFCQYCNIDGMEYGHEWGLSKKEISEWI